MAKKQLGLPTRVVKTIGSGFVPVPIRLITLLPDTLRFTGSNLALLQKHKDDEIDHIVLVRKPLSGALQSAVKFFAEKKEKELNIDKLFHLFARIHLKNGRILQIEKQEKPMITYSGPKTDGEERHPLPTGMLGGPLTFGQLINNAVKKAGAERYFKYDPFFNNCQNFITMNMKASPNIQFNASDSAWVNQNAREIAKSIPGFITETAGPAIQTVAKVTNALGINLPN